jgi:hypothetical protein
MDQRVKRFETIKGLTGFKGSIEEFERSMGPIENFSFERRNPGNRVVLSPVAEPMTIGH